MKETDKKVGVLSKIGHCCRNLQCLTKMGALICLSRSRDTM